MKTINKFVIKLTVGAFVFISLVPSVTAQTNIYKNLQWPFYDPGGSSSGEASGGLTDVCVSPLLPTINDPTKAAAAIDNFIVKQAASSPMKGLGKYFVETGQKNGINPFMVAAIANQESTFATGGGVSGVAGGFNAFGRSASSDSPNSFFYQVDGGPDYWYRWASWQDSVDDNIVPPTQSEQAYLQEVYVSKGYTELRKLLAYYLTGDPNGIKDGAGNYAEKYYKNVSSWMSEMIAAAGDGVGCGVGNLSSIVQWALKLSWPGPQTNPLTPKPGYIEAVKQYSPGGLASCNGADCGVFVSTVMRASRADPNYPESGTTLQEEYVRKSGKYDVVDKVNSTAELEPGDILIVNQGSGQGAQGHTYIYVGPQANGYNEASASLCSRMPNLDNAVLQDDRGYYLRARLK